MKSGSFGWLSLLFLILFVRTFDLSAQNASQAPTQAILSGTITNAITGVPVIGAKITVNNQMVWSVFGGFYSMQVNPVGTFPVKYQKSGFDTYTSSPVTFQSGVPVVMNITLWENLNAPSIVTSILDTSLQIVYINWELPHGNYELLYDDGIQENFTVWGLQGNMNAVRFTPVAYPAKVTGGLVHIGTEANYSAGSNPFIPFQMAVYDAGGPQGMPGNQIAGPFDVIPTKFGWNEFTFPAPVSLSGGNFYLVMIQGGNPPNSAGLAVDNTVTQLRSVSRFITGASAWIPADGNFMIRALLHGPGGPVDGDTLSESILLYQIWRLRQGEEQNPTVWTNLGSTPDLFQQDQSWFNLPCGPYRWAVKAAYSDNRVSPAKFSNILGKCWTYSVTIDVNLTCEVANKKGAFIQLKNLVYPDTVYTFTVDTSGQHTFPQVWRGSYQLTIRKFGYQNYTKNVNLVSDTLFPALLLQERPPPTGLEVEAKSIAAHWQAPTYKQTLFLEEWNGGSFQAQGWIVEGGTNWIVSSVIGNPAPSAMFSWSPQALNYKQTITSKSISSVYSPILTCSYDIVLDNFGTTSMNQMAVEIWNGSSWAMVKNYSNGTGSFPWTSEQIDISTYSDEDVKIRFRAYGEDSYDINGWNIDNINITASETGTGLTDCIFAYNFYLDDVLIGVTTDRKYVIPGTMVQYGQNYDACVLAVYGSGYSSKTCTQFTSEFLYPPGNFTATPIENNVYLAWLKPSTPYATTPPGLIGYSVFRNSVLIKTIYNPDILNHYDFGLEPGEYQYEVSARYDLTEYGFPGQFDESMRSGPVTVAINYGRDLPFFEPWDHASFAYNDWRFEPEQGNWTVDVAEGSPAPSAGFAWEPIRINYAYSLESPVLDATPYECATIWLDFDLKLEDRNSTGQEKLCVEVFYNNIWHKMTEYPNTNSFDWQPKTVDISAVAQQAFRMRFRAGGGNSSDILGWFVDNIHIYPVCLPAQNLEGELSGDDVLLTWSPPHCAGTGGELNEGFEETLFPPPGWDQAIVNASYTWQHTTANASLGAHTGNYSAGILWDYTHQDEWLIARNISVTGNLTFWSNGFQGSTYNDHYYVKISPDGGNTWDVVMDMSALPQYPSFNGYNQWETPYVIDMTLFTGQIVDIAWHAIDGDGQGLWYSWAIDDCSIGADALSLPSYEIYRRNGTTGNFNLINPLPLTDTSYLDPDLPLGLYFYYVLAVNNVCSQSLPSDTIAVDVITSLDNPEAGRLKIFPIPARDYIRIQSEAAIKRITLFDMTGRAIMEISDCNQVEIELSVSDITSGLFLMQIFTTNSTVIQLVSIIH